MCLGAEPLDENNEFLKLDNVLAMPHLGGDTNDTNMRSRFNDY